MAAVRERFDLRVAQPVGGQGAQPFEPVGDPAVQIGAGRRGLEDRAGHGREIVDEGPDELRHVRKVDLVVDATGGRGDVVKPGGAQACRGNLPGEVGGIAVRVRGMRGSRLEHREVQLQTVIGGERRIHPGRQHQSVLAERGDGLGLLHRFVSNYLR
ncbi:MAG: hypothetical protein ACXWCI_10415 [Caldimonas sp.]